MSKEKRIKSTDWLTAGYSEEEIAKMKAEAIKEAETELREKQIEEMAKAICGLNTSDGCFCDGGYCNYNCLSYEKAEFLYNAGYRKQREGVLPCKVGDIVYYISRYYTGKFKVYECIVDHITVYETITFLSLFDKKDRGINFGVNCSDPSLFFNLEEAEKELAKMKE